jgi:hypothetical protein
VGICASVQYCSRIWSKLLIEVHEERLLWGVAEITEGWTSIRVGEDHAEEAAMDRQPIVTAAVDMAQLSKVIDEMIDL